MVSTSLNQLYKFLFSYIIKSCITTKSSNKSIDNVNRLFIMYNRWIIIKQQSFRMRCARCKNAERRKMTRERIYAFLALGLLPLYHKIPLRVPPVYYFWVYGWDGWSEDSPYTELSSRENVFNDLICVVALIYGNISLYTDCIYSVMLGIIKQFVVRHRIVPYWC